jgi:predicted RNA binding protein YcfA (HicA-like mRNA interferase family)
LNWLRETCVRPRICSIVERRGWQLLRTSGSHPINGRLDGNVRLSIPIHGTQALRRGLLHHLMKLADLDEADLT